MISCHDWKLGGPYVHNLRTCEQVHFCELGTEILAVKSPSSDEKWLFHAGWRLLRKTFPRNSNKWACSCRLSLRALQAQKREGDGEREKISLFPFLPMLYHFTQAAGSVFAGCGVFTDSAIFRFDWVVASLKIHQVRRIMQCVSQDELRSLCFISILPIFRIMVRIASIYSLYVLLRRYSPEDHQKDLLIAKNK